MNEKEFLFNSSLQSIKKKYNCKNAFIKKKLTISTLICANKKSPKNMLNGYNETIYNSFYKLLEYIENN